MRIFNLKNIGEKTLSLVIPIALAIPQLTSAQDKPDWQKHIDWSSTDTGAPDCPYLYVSSDLQACLPVHINPSTWSSKGLFGRMVGPSRRFSNF
jgi:hypothetical protein